MILQFTSLKEFAEYTRWSGGYVHVGMDGWLEVRSYQSTLAYIQLKNTIRAQRAQKALTRQRWYGKMRNGWGEGFPWELRRARFFGVLALRRTLRDPRPHFQHCHVDEPLTRLHEGMAAFRKELEA
jgi:hypothetical protein